MQIVVFCGIMKDNGSTEVNEISQMSNVDGNPVAGIRKNASCKQIILGAAQGNPRKDKCQQPCNLNRTSNLSSRAMPNAPKTTN